MEERDIEIVQQTRRFLRVKIGEYETQISKTGRFNHCTCKGFRFHGNCYHVKDLRRFRGWGA